MSGKLIKLLTIALALTAATALAGEDHTEHITGPFASGPEVTKECLECHEDAAADIMKTSHWTWTSEQDCPKRGKVDRGKKNALNNFCVSVVGNWPRCTSCHIGYGWKDDTFDFTDQSKVDCLVCHDTTGTYKKNPKGAGAPNKDVDLLYVAQSVGMPNRHTCGSCHFFGGGGDKVKHGDLDTSLFNPTPSIDVHMSKDGGDMLCQDCHKTKDHSIEGHALVVSPRGRKHAGHTLECNSCHEGEPHSEPRLNKHMERIACQTCHIPTFAKALPTKIHWDWSTAGDLDREAVSDEYGMSDYNHKKGSFKFGKDIVPAYKWFDTTGHAHLMGDKLDPTKVTELNWPTGSKEDPTSKISPFKIHTGRQIYDTKNNYLITPKLFGKGGYWKTYDWNKASELGMKASGLEYSGEYGFTDTIMYWSINHMVVPAEQALNCLDCHGSKSRMDWAALGYEKDPMDM